MLDKRGSLELIDSFVINQTLFPSSTFLVKSLPSPSPKPLVVIFRKRHNELQRQNI